MIDGIIKADGTSRLIRANLPATYEEFKAQAAAGTLPMDVLFNEAGWSQLPTFLNKSNLLNDATTALFSMGTGAAPNDVFKWLGAYNLHWWRTRSNKSGYAEHLEDLSSVNVTETPNYSHAGYDVYYYDDLSFDASGNFVLSGEHTVVVSYDTYTNANVLRGKYFYPTRNGTPQKEILYYMPTTAGITRLTSGSGQTWYYVRSEVHVVSKRYFDAATEWTYLQNPDKNAYPVGGIVDGIEYQYLGVPFQNAVTSPKIATGSYTGTGTSGSSNKNSLTFDFKPQIVLISTVSSFDGGSSGDSSYSVRQYHPAIAIRGQTKGFNNGYVYINSWTEVKTTIEWEDYGLTWYFSHSGYPSQQMNESGTVYYYVAIG